MIPVLETLALDVEAAADALARALAGGLDPEADPPRSTLQVGAGALLVMPSATASHAAVKLVTVGGDPRVQGVCVLFDAATLAPLALLDGVALTNLRTPAVSLLAARYLAPAVVRSVVVVGRGPQASAHAAALGARFAGAEVRVFGRDGRGEPAAGAGADRAAASGALTGRGEDLAVAVAGADVVCCATTAREPLFDGARVGDDVLVIAMGSHEPDARELDAALLERATVVVESRSSAAREAGDLILAGVAPDLTLAELVAGAPVPPGRPRVFKSTGMSWEDAVLAAAAWEAQPK